jgi:hypothetical protein
MSPWSSLAIPRGALRVLAVVVTALAVAGCASGGASGGATPVSTPVASSGGDPSVIPLIVSTEQVVGPNRFVFSFIDPDTNLPVASPDRPASVAFIAPGQTDPGPAVPATFVWAIEGERGDYVASTSFPEAGDWKAVFITQAPGGPQEAIGVDFPVRETGTTIAAGKPAPSTTNPTSADVGGDLSKISTDKEPDPAFYQLTVADALTQHKPFVLVFATPAFCQSAQCGPTLDRVKAASASAPDDVAFINVEPYQLAYTEGRLQPVLDADNQLQPVDAVNEWGLVSEPWIFTVGKDGIVDGSFEGVVGDEELKAAIARIAG